MQSVSQAYKNSMKQALRERGYLTVYMGVINLEAQKGAHVNAAEVNSLSGITQPFTGQIPDRFYATAEQNFAKVDGSMFFEPETAPYYNQGIISDGIKGSVKIYFDIEYDLRGMTVLFGECYPTRFTIQTAAGSKEYTNNSPEWRTTDIFKGVSWVKIIPDEMVNGNGRMRILQFTCGTSVTVPTKKINNYSVTDVVSPITQSLPTQDMKLELSNIDGTFNVDDESSIINYFEKGQEIQAIFSYDVEGDGVLEYVVPQTFYMKSADADDQKASISATDRFQVMDGTYYGGKYFSSGTTLYALAQAVFSDAGLDSGEYLIDPYLKNVTVYNPLPVCTHKEAIQIIANAGRCVILFNRRGQIQMKSAFIPDVAVSAENEESWSNAAGILSDEAKAWYATAEFAPIDTDCHFLPETGNYTVNTGFVSAQADVEGTFTENPVIVLTMESTFTCFGLKIVFHDSQPQEFSITTYLNGTEVESIACTPQGVEFATFWEFAEFDVMKMTFTKAQPNRRIMVKKIQFGDVTDYMLTGDRDLLSVPKARKQDRLQAMEITKTIYNQTSEKKDLSSEENVAPDAEGYYTVYLNNASYGYELDCDAATISDSSCWFVRLHTDAASFSYTLKGYEYAVSESIYRANHNVSGIVKSWKNELISNTTLAADLEEWLAAYFMADMEYDLSYRGDPRIDANDLFDMEMDGRQPIRVRAYSHTLKYGGAWEGSMKVRKV